MDVIPMKEARLVVVVDDLDFGIKDIPFETKVFNRYGTFNQIANRSMEELCIGALWFVKQGSSNHNHLEGEIASYRNAW